MPSSQTPLDCLLDILKTPSLAENFSRQTDLWSEIKRFAEIHRFSGWLAHAASQWLPPSERSWRDQVLMTHHRRHVQRLAALRGLLEAFRAAGLACISLKGPLLAERFYAVPFLRSSSDLDLLIHLKDVGASARLLGTLGFYLEGSYPWPLQHRLRHDLEFMSADRSLRVELHYDLHPGSRKFASAGYIERSVRWTSPSGFEARVLNPADEAFYSCVHAAGHAFHRLRWLYDAITIARHLTPEERGRVRESAIEQGQRGRLVATAMAAREFFAESLDLDCDAFPVPWLWRPLTPQHTRKMVERVEGATSTLLEKAGGRLDLYRMAGSPLDATRLVARHAQLEIRKLWYSFRHPRDPKTLARTLPD